MYNLSANISENMERDYIAGLYQSLGLSIGEELSSKDMSLLYCKVFRVPSNTDEATKAMKKVTGIQSCFGENVLDVLLEMEREREKKENLYWDLQLLNAGNLDTIFAVDTPDIISPHMINGRHQTTEPNTLNQLVPRSVQSHTLDTDSSRWEMPVGRREPYGTTRGMRRLNKSARQYWARLASEGLQSILMPSQWQGPNPGFRSQAWGCGTLSDVLLLVGVKYDVVTHLLYTEMLQEHHTLNIWENMLPWQQSKEEEGLELFAEEALESGDILHLAELPGALRIYRASFRSSLDCREQSWSAVWLLCELHRFRQQEKDTLADLSERLDRESMNLVCLYIRLATLRAQRENVSFKAFLAARQSWEAWPHVTSPCRADQVSLGLHDREEQQERHASSVSSQQAVLQLLVLTQEKEREHLVKLVDGVSMDDLQEPACRVAPHEDSHSQASLRDGCIARLRQIRSGQWTYNETPVNKTHTQPQIQANIISKAEMWSQQQMEDCSLVILAHLMELQDVQASVVLPALLEKSSRRVQALRDEYESKLQAQHYSNLLQVLLSDAPPNSGSILRPYPNSTENSTNEQTANRSCCSAPVTAQNRTDGTPEDQTVDSSIRSSRELNEEQAKSQADKQDVCSGCRVVREDLPYLEILCLSDSTSNTQKRVAAEGEDQEKESSATKNYEKEDSLITLAWSKPPEDDAENDTEAAPQSKDDGSRLKTPTLPSDMSSTCKHSHCEGTSCDREDRKPTLLQSDSKGYTEADVTEQRCTTKTKLSLEKRAPPEQPEKSHNLMDPTEMKQHTDDTSSGLTNETTDVGRELVEDDSSPAQRETIIMERERIGEPVSAIERETTLQNLVEMQRKVEQRQQRDRERQLLRVQERLSIIQNRKADEDLFGLKHTDRLKHLTQDLAQEDKNKQKTIVRERLEQLRKERSFVMQSKRDRNTVGFKELLTPVALCSREANDGVD